MFNFTTQTLFNSIVDEGANKNLRVVEGKKPAVRIGNTRFDKGTVLDIHMKKHTPENLAKVTFDLSKVISNSATADEAGNYRIALYLQLSASSQDSFYANDYVYKGKPLYVEFLVKQGDSTENVAKRLVSNANKFFLFIAQEKILSVTQNGGKVTFTGVNGYQQIKKAALQKYDPELIEIDCCGKSGDFADIIVGIPRVYTLTNGVVANVEDASAQYLNSEGTLSTYNLDSETPITPGIEAFCDYNWIMHNLRLPTLANTYVWSVNKPEMPAFGGEYTQFIIRMCVERDGIAGHVVGQRATSVTTHVLYVLDDAQGQNVSKVQTALNKVLPDGETIKTDAEEALAEPYQSVTE